MAVVVGMTAGPHMPLQQVGLPEHLRVRHNLQVVLPGLPAQQVQQALQGTVLTCCVVVQVAAAEGMGRQVVVVLVGLGFVVVVGVAGVLAQIQARLVLAALAAMVSLLCGGLCDHLPRPPRHG